jgi:hypothetical protein
VTATPNTFTHSSYLARCIGTGAVKGCGRLFIPSVEAIAVVVAESDSPITDAEAVRDGFTFCEHCNIAGTYGLDPSDWHGRREIDGPMEYPYDYFLNMVWPEIEAHLDPDGGETGWTPNVEGHTGCVMWTHPDTDWTLHATPFWEDAKGIALQWDHPDGRQEMPADLPFPLMGDERDAATYLRTMGRYLDTVTPGILLVDPTTRSRRED